MKAKIKDTPIKMVIMIMIAIAIALSIPSCKTANLPNGCKYRINAPKFNK
jgi:hypothetical protein